LTLHLGFRFPGSIQIFVKTLTGQTITYDDDTSEYGMRRVDIDGNKYYLAEDTGELFLRNSNNSLGEEVGRWNVNRIRYA
jgi:hypothetical protein